MWCRIFEHEGSRLICSAYSGRTVEEAGKPSDESWTAEEFAEAAGIRDTGESFEFVDGAAVPNRTVVLASLTFERGIPMLCIGGPLLNKETTE